MHSMGAVRYCALDIFNCFFIIIIIKVLIEFMFIEKNIDGSKCNLCMYAR